MHSEEPNTTSFNFDSQRKSCLRTKLMSEVGADIAKDMKYLARDVHMDLNRKFLLKEKVFASHSPFRPSTKPQSILPRPTLQRTP